MPLYLRLQYLSPTDPQYPFSFLDIALGLGFSLLFWLAVVYLTRRSTQARVYRLACLVKIVCVWVFAAVVFFYYPPEDTIGYHLYGALDANSLIYSIQSYSFDYFAQNSPFDLGVSATAHMRFLSALAHAVSLNSFIASSLLFAVLGFIGQVLLYKLFSEAYPDPRLRIWWRGGILFFPTLTLWSAGMVKDTVGLFGIACILWGFERFLRHPRLGYFAVSVVGVWAAAFVRLQVLLVFLVAFLPMLALTPEIGQLPIFQRHRGVRRISPRVYVTAVIIVVTVIAIRFIGSVSQSLDVSNLPQTISSVGSRFARRGGQAGAVSSYTSLLRSWPSALLLTLYRPSLIEARSPFAAFAGLENAFLSLLTFRVGLLLWRDRRPFARALHDPLFAFSLVFVLFFALGVGASTPNVGTISRYRIALDPFFIATFIIIEYYAMQLGIEMPFRWLNAARPRAMLRRARRVVPAPPPLERPARGRALAK